MRVAEIETPYYARPEGSISKLNTWRDGLRTGDANGQSIGEVHDRALGAAETDATKRALATFGKAFGLALYAPTQSARPGRGHASAPERAPDTAETAHSVEQEADELPVAAGKALAQERTANGATMAIVDHVARSESSVAQRIDKSVLTLDEPRRTRDKEHLRFVSTQPCLLCSSVPSDAHHIRFAQPRAIARKVGDEFTVPLCRKHHQELHQYGNEAAWWHDMGIDPIEIAGQLGSESRSKVR